MLVYFGCFFLGGGDGDYFFFFTRTEIQGSFSPNEADITEARLSEVIT